MDKPGRSSISMHYNFIVPFRNREDSLKVLLEELPKAIAIRPYITSYYIIIVEQLGDKPFNLGKLLNCGFDYVKKGFKSYSYSPWDVYFFHPVDLLPEDDTDYRHDEIGVTWLCDPNEHWGYPKAILMQNAYFQRINGFVSTFYGWGGEDFEMAIRCQVTETNYLNRKARFRSNESTDPRGLSIRQPPEIYHETIADLSKTKNVYYSGLNTLEYKKVKEVWLNEKTVHLYLDLKASYE